MLKLFGWDCEGYMISARIGNYSIKLVPPWNLLEPSCTLFSFCQILC